MLAQSTGKKTSRASFVCTILRFSLILPEEVVFGADPLIEIAGIKRGGRAAEMLQLGAIGFGIYVGQRIFELEVDIV